jgi:predicted RNA-binding Zn-ribbon protein involved in translation (DUF1610 family)
MPPRSMLSRSEFACPECYEDETYVHKINDRFLCSDCNYSAPEEEVEELQGE